MKHSEQVCKLPKANILRHGLIDIVVDVEGSKSDNCIMLQNADIKYYLHVQGKYRPEADVTLNPPSRSGYPGTGSILRFQQGRLLRRAPSLHHPTLLCRHPILFTLSPSTVSAR